MTEFSSSIEHLLAEFERIDLLIQMHVQRARRIYAADNAFQGLVITEEEVDALLASPAGLPAWAAASEPWRPEQVETAIAQLSAKIGRRKAASAEQSIALRLDRLATLFALTPFDVDALLVCLAPEIDLRYQRLYAYLQDDVTRRYPSVDLVLNLLSPTLTVKLAARERFMPEAPLLKHQLLHIFDDPAQPESPLLGKYLRVDERIAGYLLGSNSLDSRLLPYCTLVVPQARLEDVLLPAGVRQRLERVVRDGFSDDRPVVVHFQGPPGTGKQTTAEALCREVGLGLLVVNGDRLLAAETGRVAEAVQLVGREALLHEAAVYWQGWDTMLPGATNGDDSHGRGFDADDWRRALTSQPALIFLAGAATWEPAGWQNDVLFARIEFSLPDTTERLLLWQRSLTGSAPPGGDLDLTAVAAKFRLNGSQIRDAAATARNLAYWRVPDQGRVTAADLHAASRLHSNRNLISLARKITPHYAWDDIILPADRLEQLRELCNRAKHRARVYDEWGFDRKLALGKGLNVLFAGPSGTGKTMAAEVMANELGLDLYKIDLSTVISKYIGETEKNLARIFSEAETSNAILFFDEADALFGKRSEVRDSHDRYANIEIAYLLQRMEEYQGLAILATNLRQNMDDAFVRRLQFIVEFPLPDEAHRFRIWQGHFPPEAPLVEDVDLPYLARQFRISGGNIKNIVLGAAFLAAADGGRIGMGHLVQSTRREYQKMGKPFSDADLRRG